MYTEALTEAPNTALAKQPELRPSHSLDLLRTRLAEAEIYLKSGLLPKHIRTPEAAVLVMAMGRELGIKPLAAARLIYVVDGVPTCSAQLMLALVRRDHGPDALRVIESDADHAVVEVREGKYTRQFTWTLQDAKRAGLLGKDVWTKYPQAMLKWRAIAEAARSTYPESIGGLYTSEELDAPAELAGAWDDVPESAPRRDASPEVFATPVPAPTARYTPVVPPEDAETLHDLNASVSAGMQSSFTSREPPASEAQLRSIRAHLERTGMAVDWVLPEGRTSLEDLTLPEASAVLGRLGRTPNAS